MNALEAFLLTSIYQASSPTLVLIVMSIPSYNCFDNSFNFFLSIQTFQVRFKLWCSTFLYINLNKFKRIKLNFLFLGMEHTLVKKTIKKMDKNQTKEVIQSP